MTRKHEPVVRSRPNLQGIGHRSPRSSSEESLTAHVPGEDPKESVPADTELATTPPRSTGKYNLRKRSEQNYAEDILYSSDLQ